MKLRIRCRGQLDSLAVRLSCGQIRNYHSHLTRLHATYSNNLLNPPSFRPRQIVLRLITLVANQAKGFLYCDSFFYRSNQVSRWERTLGHHEQQPVELAYEYV